MDNQQVSKGVPRGVKLVVFGVVAAFLLYFGIILALRGADGFFSKNDLEFPPVVEMKFSWPVRVVPRKVEQKQVKKPVTIQVVPAVEARELTKAEQVAGSLYPTAIDRIWVMESGRGTATDPKALNVYCAAKGMTNEFGYDPAHRKCFATFADSVRAVESTLTSWGIETDLVNALCTYNLGGLVDADGAPLKHQNCNYYQKYLNL